VFQSRDCEKKAFRGQFVEVWRLARHDALEIDPEPEVVTHGNEDIGLLLLLRGCGRARHRHCGKQPNKPSIPHRTHGSSPPCQTTRGG
jgi:hypothetical protein